VWHIDCADGMTRSTASVIKKNNNVKWMCNDCVSMLDVIYQRMDQIWAHVVRHNELIEQQKDVLEKIEQKVEKMSKNFEESDVQINDKLQKVIQCSSKKMTYAEKLRSTSQEAVVIIKPIKDQSSSETQKQIKDKIDPVDVEINSIRNVSNGAVIIGCNNKAAAEKLQKEVVEKMGVDYELKMPEGLKPQLKIVGISEKMEKEEMISKLKAQNEVFRTADSLKIAKIEVARMRTDKFNAIIEVDGKVFDQVLKMERIKIGWDRCRFFENMNVRRCFKCNGYNHKAEECKNKNACGNCAEEHDTRQCKNETGQKCINCVLANKNLGFNLKTDHCAWSRDCKVYKKKENDKRRKINYCDI
jgi:hypothetical protein